MDKADLDCDGIANDDDCDQKRFCDGEATRPEARAGCIAEKCTGCEVDGHACAIGTRVTCRDVPGQPRTYSCDAGGSCGTDLVCLPENACQLGCGEPPVFSLVACLENAWETGAQADQAIDCALPTMATSMGSRACSGGSTVEVSLPFSACSNPHVLVGYSSDYAARASVVSPCTLRVTIDGPDTVFLEALLVTMNTAAESATVRFMLHPTDGPCSGIETCGPVKSTAICQI